MLPLKTLVPGRTKPVPQKPGKHGQKSSPQSKKTRKPENAGPQWFDMPAPKLTPELVADLHVIKARSVLDPSRHYVRDSRRKLVPKFAHVGTVVVGPHEYFSSRLARKQRRPTIAEEILADTDRCAYLKRKAVEIQHTQAAGALRKQVPKKGARRQRRSQQKLMQQNQQKTRQK